MTDAKHLADGDADIALAFVIDVADYLGLPRHWYAISSDHAGKGNNAAIEHEFDATWAGVVTELELMTDLWALALARTEEIVGFWDTANERKQPVT